MDNVVYHFWQRGEEVGRVDLGIKEDFWSQEALVADVNVVFLREKARFSLYPDTDSRETELTLPVTE